MRRVVCGVAAFGLGACEPRTGLEGVELESAAVTDFGAFYFGVVLGVEVAEATLVAETTEGDTLEVPITMSGPRLGVVVELAYGMGVGEFPLLHDVADDGEGVFLGEDCFGSYQGFEASAGVIGGLHYTMLSNEAGTVMPILSVPIGAAGGFNWVSVVVEPKLDE